MSESAPSPAEDEGNEETKRQEMLERVQRLEKLRRFPNTPPRIKYSSYGDGDGSAWDRWLMFPKISSIRPGFVQVR